MSTALHPDCTCRWTHSQEELTRDEHCVNHGNQGTRTHLGILREAFGRIGFIFTHVVETTADHQYLVVFDEWGASVVRFDFNKDGSKK